MSLNELAELMFTPHGREFCADNDFPTRADINDRNFARLRDMGIYVNAGKVEITDPENVCFIGKTEAVVTISGPDHIFRVVALDKAKVHVKASGYAVGSVEASKTATITIDNDNTAVIHVAQR